MWIQWYLQARMSTNGHHNYCFLSSSWIMMYPKSTGFQFDAKGIHKFENQRSGDCEHGLIQHQNARMWHPKVEAF
jgi:hypothetical protein